MTLDCARADGSSSLAGLTIAYTRSYDHWQRFHPHVLALGGEAIHMPLLHIIPRAIEKADQIKLNAADFIVFTSANAVNHYFGQGLVIAPEQTAVSIGERTTQALTQHNSHAATITAPPPYDSEALLQVFNPKDKNICIIAAPHGRQLLFDRLSQSNQVDFIYVYQRECQSISPSIIKRSLDSQIILIASCSSLDCLMENYPQEALKLIQYKACIAGISAKVASYAHSLGFQHTIYSCLASEHVLINTVAHWWSINKELER